MKIAVDIDGVLRDLMGGFWEYYNRENSTDFKSCEQGVYNLGEIIGVSYEEAGKLLDDYCLSEDFKMVKAIEGSSDAVALLKRYHELFAITACPSWMKEDTEEFLGNNYSGHFSQLIFSGEFYPGQSSKSKDKICGDLEIGVIVEDNAFHSECYAGKGLQVLLFNQPWNQKLSHENVIRCYGWGDVVAEIKKYEGSLIQNGN
ncbi:hypothetical protein HOA55_00105 [archaeon]|jgi:uncharacterized protein|nr:hypothetical protein [archaeon]MBT3577894.1 hypothetical protein [archaeon]MBT6819742.1 hypothetical protein [archaeon]MBT6956026.1 hypothetical protein [archaeon]MBT7025525.1 hypothetical protein [archaeon]